MPGTSYAGQNTMAGGYGGYNPYASGAYGAGQAGATSGLQNRQLDLQEREFEQSVEDRDREFQSLMFQLGVGDPGERSNLLSDISGGKLSWIRPEGPSIGGREQGSEDINSMLINANNANRMSREFDFSKYGFGGMKFAPNNVYSDISSNLTDMARGLSRGSNRYSLATA